MPKSRKSPILPENALKMLILTENSPLAPYLLFTIIVYSIKMPKTPKNRQFCRKTPKNIEFARKLCIKTPKKTENRQKTPILPENAIKTPILTENFTISTFYFFTLLDYEYYVLVHLL